MVRSILSGSVVVIVVISTGMWVVHRMLDAVTAADERRIAELRAVWAELDLGDIRRATGAARRPPHDEQDRVMTFPVPSLYYRGSIPAPREP